MAQTKTDYGLIYNTDGSMCTTVRPDQTPFPGVNSFAVETATTNLVTNSPQNLQSIILQYPGAEITTELVTSGNLAGWAKIHITKVGDLQYIFRFQDMSVPQQADNTTRTYAIDFINPYPELYLYLTGSLAVGNLNKISNIRYAKTWTNNTGTNKGLSIYVKSTLPAGTTGSWDVYARNYQIEEKPFASSFVVGSRPPGSFVIPVEDLKFDIANDDWVISYWKYPVATSDDTQNGLNICSLGRYTSDSSKGYIAWGKVQSINKYYLFIALNDATSIKINSDNTFNPTDYFYNWHYEVLKKQGKVLSYYVDGVKQCEVTIPADKEIQTPFDLGLNLGGDTYINTFYPTNALIAAPYYGYNSATWTDDYIREVYEAQIPFSVQSQLSIF